MTEPKPLTSEPSSVPFWWKYTDGDTRTGEHWIPEDHVADLLAESRARTLEEVKRWLEGKLCIHDAECDCIRLLTEEITKI